MNLPTLLTEAAMKGAERRAEFRIGSQVDRCLDAYEVTRGDDETLALHSSYADCTAFIEREGLRASMAWIAENLGTLDTNTDPESYWTGADSFLRHLAGGGET